MVASESLDQHSRSGFGVGYAMTSEYQRVKDGSQTSGFTVTLDNAMPDAELKRKSAEFGALSG
jgi:hypothetical protein